ncbi:MAG: transporter substrate-binding domain-containing protein [Candidatus Bipolaricaulota bacterium]
MKRLMLLVGMLVCVALVAPVFGEVPSTDRPLRAAVDMGYVPFAFVDEDGNEIGFAIDLAGALADRMGYPGVEIVSVQWAGIFAALDAGRVDFIAAPTNIRRERAENMLFSEPYMDTAQLIAVNARLEEQVETVDDLEGLIIGVNTGSVSDDWLVANEDAYGYEIDRYDNLLDALLAADTGRVDAVIGDYEAVAYAALDRPNVVPAVTIRGEEQYGVPCRKGDNEFRDLLEKALEGLKLDGTLLELHEKWFGVEPEAGSAAMLVYAGFGVPGLPGYDLEFHEPTF